MVIEYPKAKVRRDNLIFIFDLDGTVIDSRHRQGESLADWFRLNTRENIFKDVPLRLGGYIKELYYRGYKVLICTSRSLGKDDLDYLYDVLEVPTAIKLVSRRHGDNTPSFTLKKKKLSYLENFKHSREKVKILIDDEQDNLNSFEELGGNCYGIHPEQAEEFIQIVLQIK